MTFNVPRKFQDLNGAPFRCFRINLVAGPRPPDAGSLGRCRSSAKWGRDAKGRPAPQGNAGATGSESGAGIGQYLSMEPVGRVCDAKASGRSRPSAVVPLLAEVAPIFGPSGHRD
jgi:hypothetical protein